jgi:hypothetical protein
VCELVERIPAGPRPLDDVREDVVRALTRERRKDSAMRKARAFRLSLRASSKQTMDEAAATYGYTVQSTDTFTVAQPIGNQPPRSPLAYGVFNVDVDAFTKPIESYGSIFVAECVYRQPFDQQAFSLQVEAIRSRLYQAKSQEYIAYWYENLRKNADIEDYRSSL